MGRVAYPARTAFTVNRSTFRMWPPVEALTIRIGSVGGGEGDGPRPGTPLAAGRDAAELAEAAVGVQLLHVDLDALVDARDRPADGHRRVDRHAVRGRGEREVRVVGAHDDPGCVAAGHEPDEVHDRRGARAVGVGDQRPHRDVHAGRRSAT